jgi:hypothetical protein
MVDIKTPLNVIFQQVMRKGGADLPCIKLEQNNQ